MRRRFSGYVMEHRRSAVRLKMSGHWWRKVAPSLLELRRQYCQEHLMKTENDLQDVNVSKPEDHLLVHQQPSQQKLNLKELDDEQLKAHQRENTPKRNQKRHRSRAHVLRPQFLGHQHLPCQKKLPCQRTMNWSLTMSLWSQMVVRHCRKAGVWSMASSSWTRSSSSRTCAVARSEDPDGRGESRVHRREMQGAGTIFPEYGVGACHPSREQRCSEGKSNHHCPMRADLEESR